MIDNRSFESEQPDGIQWETSCHCGRITIGDVCQRCGEPLCSMHQEVNLGFCKEHPDKWFDIENRELSFIENIQYKFHNWKQQPRICADCNWPYWIPFKDHIDCIPF